MIGEEEASCDNCGTDFDVNYIPLAYGEGDHFAVEIEPSFPIEDVEDDRQVSIKEYIELKKKLTSRVKEANVVSVQDVAALLGVSVDFLIGVAEDCEDVTINVGFKTAMGYAALPRSQWSLEYLGDL